MDGLSTMDLSNSGDNSSTMVPLSTALNPQHQPPQQDPQKSQIPQGLQYNTPEKNIDKQQSTLKMDSTPISDIMSGPEVMGMGAPPPDQMDPRMLMAQAQQAPQQQQVPQQMYMAQQQQQVPQQMGGVPSKYPMNLTDEQVEALFVGLVAVIAFSKPVQEKMATLVPKFVNENGGRSTVGLASTGLVAALVFYFGRRFVLKNN